MTDTGPAMTAAEPLVLKLRNGASIAVPPTLESITTYVLLEQEQWFEKEMDFLDRYLKPGMTAIDIGANLGVYSLALARLVGPTGRVVAYEPGREPRTLLERSRDLNGASQLDIVPKALSNRAGEARLGGSPASELRALQADGSDGELVPLTTLDLEQAGRGWASVDFMKIDAEGEEENILAGGRDFLQRHSPLILFELKAGAAINENLRALFPKLGYRLFRQLGGAAVFVPDDATKPVDGFELNLLAAKPDRVAKLVEQGLLVEAIVPFNGGGDPGAVLKSQPFWRSIEAKQPGLATQDPVYRDGLVAYAVWRSADRPLAERCAALAHALDRLRAAAQASPTSERLVTWARAAWDWGARVESFQALMALMQILRSSRPVFREPFWPPNPRFDAIEASGDLLTWFGVAAAEQLERASSFSTRFGQPSGGLDWLVGQPLAAAEMVRRHVLFASLTGKRPAVPARLRTRAADHLNDEVWKQGRVPGTSV